jgi:D-alanyl-D-alanine carboxypeptidase
MYIVFDHIEKGYLSLQSQIPVSTYAASRSVNPGESNVPLNETLTYSVDEMIKALCVVSANACAVALGEYISGGTEQDFAVIMNRYADSLGLNAQYTDASGLSSGNGISPRSMALLTREFIIRFPEILNFTSLTSMNFRGTTYGLQTVYYRDVLMLTTDVMVLKPDIFCGGSVYNGYRKTGR